MLLSFEATGQSVWHTVLRNTKYVSKSELPYFLSCPETSYSDMNNFKHLYITYGLLKLIVLGINCKLSSKMQHSRYKCIAEATTKLVKVYH